MQQGDEDEDEARRLARLSLSPGRPMEVASHLAMLTILAGSPDLSEQSSVAQDLVRLQRDAVARTPDSPVALRNLSVSLDNVGRVREWQGDLDGALGAFTEKLELTRRVVERYAVSPESLRDLSVSWGNVGRVRELPGDLDGAGRDYAQAAGWCMSLNERYPGPLSDEGLLQQLKASLQRVGADAPADPSGR